MAEIVTFGEVLAESMALERGQSLGEPGHFAGPFPGGAPAIFIDQAATLGARAALVGAVGVDAFGDMLIDRLRTDGVDVSAIARRKEMTTASAFVTYRDDGSREFIFNIANSASAAIRWAQFAPVLADCRLLHVTGSSLFCAHMIDLARAACDQVRAAGGRVSFDPNIRDEMWSQPGVAEALADLLSRTDILLPSEGELNRLTGIADDDSAARYAFARGVREIVFKQGRNGCRYHDGATIRAAAGYAVDEVDPTGAGDIFGATFCTLRLQGTAIDEALRYANAAGARAVTCRGAMQATATRQALDAFIEARDGSSRASGGD